MAAVEKIVWAPGKKTQFEEWLSVELHQTLGDRAALERVWQDNIVQWRARVVGDGVSDIPFVGASDLPMPLTAMHVDPVLSDFMQTLHVPQDFFAVVGKRPDTVDVAKPLQRFLSRVERGYVKMRSVNAKTLLDVAVHGTGIYKDYIVHERRMLRGRSGEVTPQLIHQPRIQHVPLQDFFIPAYAYDIDPDAPNGAAPWVSHRFYLSKEQLRERATAESPWLPAYDKDVVDEILMYEEDVVEPIRNTIDRESKYQPWQRRKVELHEVWARATVDASGLERDIVVIWHHGRRKILRVIANPFLHGKRPFEAPIYLPGMGFYGMGLAEIDEWAQMAMERIMNNVIDNTLIANSVMIGAPAGMNISPDEPIHMNKIWSLGPNEDLKTVQLGRPNPQAANTLGMFMQWAEQRTSVSELRQGDISSLPSRTPAASTMSILAEGKKRFDMILSNLREGPLQNLGVRFLQNLIQISQTDPRWKAFAMEVLGPKDGALVAEILSSEVYDVDAKFGISVSATSGQINKDMERSTQQQLLQLNSSVYPMLMQWAQTLQDQPLMIATAQAAYRGTVESLRRLHEAHDTANPETYLPDVSQAPSMQTMQPPVPGAPAGVDPAAMGAPNAGAVPGIDPALLQLLRGF